LNKNLNEKTWTKTKQLTNDWPTIVNDSTKFYKKYVGKTTKGGHFLLKKCFCQIEPKRAKQMAITVL
jgi:hypothetical protein